jgi:hypothetical protein
MTHLNQPEEVKPRECAYYLPGHNVYSMVAIKDASLDWLPAKVRHFRDQMFEVTYEGKTEIWFTHDEQGLRESCNRETFVAEHTTRVYVRNSNTYTRDVISYSCFHMSREPIAKCKAKRTQPYERANNNE